jgi:hypothetical protein
MTAAFHSIRGRLDQAGVLISGLCAVHCLLSIIVVGVLGLGGQVLLSPWIHRVGLGAAIVIGLFTLALGAVRHARYDNLRIGAAGLGLMGGALLVDHGVVEAGLTVLGVTLVALAHIRNLRARA